MRFNLLPIPLTRLRQVIIILKNYFIEQWALRKNEQYKASLILLHRRTFSPEKKNGKKKESYVFGRGRGRGSSNRKRFKQCKCLVYAYQWTKPNLGTTNYIAGNRFISQEGFFDEANLRMALCEHLPSSSLVIRLNLHQSYPSLVLSSFLLYLMCFQISLSCYFVVFLSCKVILCLNIFRVHIRVSFPILFLIDTGEGRDKVLSPAHLRAAMLLKRLLPPRNVRPPMTAKILRVVNMFCEETKNNSSHTTVQPYEILEWSHFVRKTKLTEPIRKPSKNMKRVPSAGKKKAARVIAIGLGLAPDWLQR